MAVFNGTAGLDVFNGPNHHNTFSFELNELQSFDIVFGGNQDDVLELFGQGAFILNASNFLGVSGIEFVTFSLSNVQDVSIAIPNALVASSDFVGQAEDDLTITTAQGDDSIDVSAVGAGFSLSVDGYLGDDTIIGGAAEATYIGGSGDDHLIAGLGIETFIGYGYAGGGTGETDVDSVEGTAQAVDGDTYDSSDNDPGETITVTSAGTFDFETGGFETVNLANGTNHATIQLTYFFRQITIEGGSGNDTVTVLDPTSADQIGSGIFGMTMNGRNGEDVLHGTSQGDSLFGGTDADILYGNSGNDRLTGGAGGDTMYGGMGSDRYLAVGSGDVIVEAAGGGTDTIETALAAITMADHVENLQFTGTTATDITGNGVANTIWAGDFGDTVNGAAGGDTVYGGEGGDTISGQKGADTLEGEEGDDTLEGGQGDDFLVGGGDNDTLRGGDGYDTADYSGAAAGLDIDLDRADEVMVNGTVDQLSSIEKVIGGGFDDRLAASDANQVDFLGGGGFDTLDLSRVTAGISSQSNGDAEHIIGGSGNDFLAYYVWAEGGDGNDDFWSTTELPDQTYDGGDGVDSVAYFIVPFGPPPAVNIVDLENNALNQGRAAGDILISIENLYGGDFTDDSFYGTGEDNILGGGNGENQLFGRGGDDTLTGGTGLDQLFGEDGDDLLVGRGFADQLFGGDGTDTADYSASPAGVTIILAMAGGSSAGLGLGGDAEGDVIEDIENFIGSAQQDTLTGTDPNNRLSGGGGDDFLTGGEGRDMLEGGTGADMFIWRSAHESRVGNKHDTVSDFSQAEGDTIDLSVIDAIKGHADDAFHLTAGNGTGAFTSTAGELRFFQSGNDTLVQADIEGDGAADIEIVLTGLIVLTAADFIL